MPKLCVGRNPLSEGLQGPVPLWLDVIEYLWEQAGNAIVLNTELLEMVLKWQVVSPDSYSVLPGFSTWLFVF